MIREIQMASQLADLRDTMKRLYGSEWRKATKDYRAALAVEMKRKGQTNPLAAVLPIAKRIRAAGRDASLILAVAAEMASEVDSGVDSEENRATEEPPQGVVGVVPEAGIEPATKGL